MKRFLCVGLVLLAGCSRTTTTTIPLPAGSPSESDTPRIGLVMKSLANEFFSTMADGAEAHQSEHADQYDLQVNGIRDESDVSRQIGLVDEMVAAGMDAIVIAPADSKALVRPLRKAQQAGVVVVNIDNRLDAEVLQQEGVSIPFVGPDNRAGAKNVGDYLASKLNKGDQVAILEGKTTAYNGVQRRLGFQDAMNEGGMKIVSSQSADWETNKANTIASAMLSEHPEIKAILAANDSMALGAVAAVKSASKTDDVMIIGFDNIGAAGELIREGKMLATADQYADRLAVFGIETALEILADPNADPEDVQTPVDLITAETLAD